MTLHEQKTALAERFPQILRCHPPSILIFWRDTGQEVTGREWLEVSNRLAKQMPINQRCQVAELLIDWCGELDAPFVDVPQRLEALCRVLFPEKFVDK